MARGIQPAQSYDVSPEEIHRLITVEDRARDWPVEGIGNAWSRELFGGPFYLFNPPDSLPAISLVFVQSRDGNTGASNPADLGGGPTDQHLIYEGLSRVAADGVMAGASTIGHSVFFSITGPELAALRQDLGLAKDPAQIVLSDRGRVDPDARVFSRPDVPVYLLAGPRCIDQTCRALRDRPWIHVIPIEGDLTGAFARLRRDYGLTRISCVGGRTTATSLVDAGLVQDIYLTTTAIAAGEPDTPWYDGMRRPKLDVIVRKREDVDDRPIEFTHYGL
jgi:riboflavin biosynthesis pyrimidine reductase